MSVRSPATQCVMVLTVATASLAGPQSAQAQPLSDFVPVTDAVLQDPAPGDWLMWRRTLDSWGYSPLDQIDRDNVEAIQMVWTRALGPGLQQGTPLVYNGVLYMPNPRDVIQAIDAVTGDLLWEYRRDRPDDLGEYLIASLIDTNRNLAHSWRAHHRHHDRRSRHRAGRDERVAWCGRRRFSTTRRTPPIRHRASQGTSRGVACPSRSGSTWAPGWSPAMTRR